MTTQPLYESVRTIRLYGVLGSRFGRVHRMAVKSAAEAMRALGSQLRGFDEFLAGSKDRGLGYAVFYGKANLSEQQLRVPSGGKDIRIAPMVIGAKNGGIFQIILGTALIIIGGLAAVVTFNPALATALVSMGWAMVIGGVVQLLTPVPKGRSSKDRPENQANENFNGPVNTQAQGNPVPVLYGELIVGSAIISAGINAVDHTIAPAPGSTTLGGGTAELILGLFH